MSSSALKTSAGMMVFLLAPRVCSFALSPCQKRGSSSQSKEETAYAFARWLINTVALLLRARMALAWIWVFGGRTPLAKRVIIDLGRLRS
jgi:hypothetical protein